MEIFRFVHFSRINFGRIERSWSSTEPGFTAVWESRMTGKATYDSWAGGATSLRVRGSVVAQLQQAFMDNWLKPGRVATRRSLFSRQECAGEQICQIFKSSAGEGSDSGRLMLLVSIAAARHHIRIANAYFIPDNLTMRTLTTRCVAV